jgi:hypothetical protein
VVDAGVEDELEAAVHRHTVRGSVERVLRDVRPANAQSELIKVVGWLTRQEK